MHGLERVAAEERAAAACAQSDEQAQLNAAALQQAEQQVRAALRDGEQLESEGRALSTGAQP